MKWTVNPRRGIIQQITNSWMSLTIDLPKRMADHIETAEKPNDSSDGSLKNPVGNHWAIGGIGIWGPVRSPETQPLNEQEKKKKSTEHDWCTDACRQWAASNELKNEPPGAKPLPLG